MNTERFTTARSAPLPSPQVPPQGLTEDVDILSVASTLWRGKWRIMFFMVICAMLAVAWLTSVATPRYTAKTALALQNRNEQVVDFENVLSGLGGDRFTVPTEVEVLRARNLIKKVIVKLDLLADPEFNKHIREKKSLLPEAVRNVIADIRQTFASSDAQPKPAPNDRRIMDDTIDALLIRTSINNIRSTLVFEVSITTEDPEKSALIADTLAEIYIQDQVDVKFEANERATTWLTDRVSALEVELEDAENAVKTFRASSDVVSEEALALRSRQLKDFRTRRSDLIADQSRLEGRIVDLQAARAEGPAAMALVADDPGLTALEGRLSAGGSGARAAFDARFDAVLQRADLERARNIEQLATIETSLAELDAEVEKQSSELLELKQLERVAEANRLIYEYFLGRLKEISVQRGIQQADSRLLSPSVVPNRPTSPRPALSIFMGLFLGFVMGSASVLLREMRNKTFRIPEELESQTGITVIGEIARARSTRRKRLLEDIASQSNSALVEAVRNLRTSVMLSSVSGPPQVIMLTSSVPGEGKTTLSLALAHSLGSMKKKVLLIEGDIRRRTFREYFKSDNALGLTSVVEGTATLAEAVYSSDQLGADVLMGEGVNANAADFFTSERFRDFLTHARQHYDFIVIDTPPVLAVPDARVIGPLMDVILYVVHWDRTTQRQVRQGLHSFATVNVPVTGLVLSQINHHRQKGYGYGDGYGSYAKGYYGK